MRSRVTLEFTGRLVPESFNAFAAHRAARLSVEHSIVSLSKDSAIVDLAGPDALIDAFEMAMSLGPVDCLILDVRRRDNSGARH